MYNNEKIKDAFSRIEQGLQNINTDDDWRKYLSFQSRFHNYSFSNTMLIYMQNPNASFVKGYKAWNQLGRYVRKGSKGMAIIAPCVKKRQECEEVKNEDSGAKEEKERKKSISGFRVTYVYDIADTGGSDEYLPILVSGLSGNSDTEKEIFEKLLYVVSESYTVKEVKKTASKGSYNLQTQIINIRSDMGYLQKIKTLLHETAHAIDFKMNPDTGIKRNRRELIAESVAFVVCSWLGLDTSSYSISYIHSWQKDKDELKMIADTVQKISSIMVEALEEVM
jgi:antirestriction protein ArdC